MVANVTNSQNNVVTTITMVLYELIQVFKNEISDLHIVYDEQLSYETAVRKYRSDNKVNDSDPIPFPMLAIRRSVLRHSEDRSPSRRMGRMLVGNPTSNADSQEFRSVHGEFDLEFLYINTSISDVEKFEVVYLGQEGISNFTQIDVALPEEYGDIDLPDGKPTTLPYYSRWDNLEDKVFEHSESFHKMVTGKVVVVGHYLTFRTNNKRILEIQAGFNNLVDPVGEEKSEIEGIVIN